MEKAGGTSHADGTTSTEKNENNGRETSTTGGREDLGTNVDTGLKDEADSKVSTVVKDDKASSGTEDCTGANSNTGAKDDTGAIDLSNHEFKIPVKMLSNPMDMQKWESSEAYSDLIGFIIAIGDAVQKVKISDTYPVSQTVQNLVEMLKKLSSWIDEIPPIDQPQRFGNKAFRDFFNRLKENAESLLNEALGERFAPCTPEISTYLVESVGNDTRIDYGSGHELAFAALLCCLFKVGALTQDDAKAVALKIFEIYLHLVRKLQTVYRMEPAGSHGVWSLDDYQFIPFIWGSSQLIGHPRILPKSFVNPDIFQHFSKEFMFLGCINYIHQVKTGPFAEHSNQLWNISGVREWKKVNSGLLKMYKAEVLAKFPVIQHFVFGSLLSLKPAT